MPAADKVDFTVERKDLYAPSARQFAVVEVPEFTFASVDGTGDPNTADAYVDAVQALYSFSYAAKFASKLTLGRDYTVAPLEGLWYSDRLASFTDRSKNEWSWTMMIRQPDWLTDEVTQLALAKVAAKKLQAFDRLTVAPFHEGTSVQIMHIGSYDDEAPTITRMHEWIASNGYIENGHHHEIYRSDPRKTAPSKLKTVLRQPMRQL